MWCKGIVLCVSVSLLSWTRGTGRACKSKFLEAQWESGGTGRKTWVEAAGKCLPWVLAWVEGEKGPPLLLLRRLKRKPVELWDLCFFIKTAKAVEATVCIGKMSLERAKKHMWDWERLLHKAAWKTTWAAAGQNKNVARHAAGPPDHRGKRNHRANVVQSRSCLAQPAPHQPFPVGQWGGEQPTVGWAPGMRSRTALSLSQSDLPDRWMTVTAMGGQVCFQETAFGFVLAGDHRYVTKSSVVAKRGSWVIGFCVFSFSTSYTQSFFSPRQIQVCENGRCSWKCALFLEDEVLWQLTWLWSFAYLSCLFFPEGECWVDKSNMQYFREVFSFFLSIKNWSYVAPRVWPPDVGLTTALPSQWHGPCSPCPSVGFL